MAERGNALIIPPSTDYSWDAYGHGRALEAIGYDVFSYHHRTKESMYKGIKTIAPSLTIVMSRQHYDWLLLLDCFGVGPDRFGGEWCQTVDASLPVTYLCSPAMAADITHPQLLNVPREETVVVLSENVQSQDYAMARYAAVLRHVSQFARVVAYGSKWRGTGIMPRGDMCTMRRSVDQSAVSSLCYVALDDRTYQKQVEAYGGRFVAGVSDDLPGFTGQIMAAIADRDRIGRLDRVRSIALTDTFFNRLSRVFPSIVTEDVVRERATSFLWLAESMLGGVGK
jgi:hypothetical protein